MLIHFTYGRNKYVVYKIIKYLFHVVKADTEVQVYEH